MDYLFFELMAMMVLMLVLMLVLISNQRTIVKTLFSIKYILMDSNCCKKYEGCNETILVNSDNASMEQASFNFNLSAPWVILCNKLDAFFEKDKEVSVDFYETNDKDNIITIPITVYNQRKYFALREILKKTYEFGNIKCVIKLSLKTDKVITKSIFKNGTEEIISSALRGNPLFKDLIVKKPIGNDEITYIIMAKEVLQFNSDDLTDFYQNENMVVEDAANSIFQLPTSWFFSTALE